MQHYPLIRTIYLYLFTIVGLTLLVIGSVRFVDMGLKMFVFTKADANQKYYDRPIMVPYSLEKLEIAKEDEGFTEEERESIKQWLEDYEKIEEEQIDQITVNRHRDASINLAMILIGLPLYIYHWRLIRKETKN